MSPSFVDAKAPNVSEARCVVRRASPSDIDWMIDELHHFSAFYDSIYEPMGDIEYCKVVIKDWIENHLVLVSEVNYEPTGFMVGLIHTHIFNPSIRCLSEALWWVKESKRNSRAGLLLLNKFIEFGRENVDWIFCTIEEKSPVNDKSLVKRGFKPMEKCFLMEVV